MIDLVAELIGGAQRQRLAQVIAADLAEISFGLTVDRQAHPAAMLCAERINDYVHRLGTNLMAEKERPRIQLPEGQNRALFRAHAASDLCDDLPAQPRRVAEELWTDWVFALEDLFRRNAADAEGGTVNIENNHRLGEILARLTIGQD